MIKVIDEAIKYYLNLHVKDDSLKEIMEYALFSGGKRIRPCLVLDFCKLCGGDIKKALPFAVAVEFVHSYSLVHDDLPAMDNDDFRRGKPSCHKFFGESSAILCGDALLNLALEIILSEETQLLVEEKTQINCAKVLLENSGANGLILGQFKDLKEDWQNKTCAQIEDMFFYKTAKLFVACCQMGVLVAGGTSQNIKLAEKYGTNLGLAYQIKDDILDADTSFYLKKIGEGEAYKKLESYTQNAVEALLEFDDLEENIGSLKLLALNMAVRKS